MRPAVVIVGIALAGCSHGKAERPRPPVEATLMPRVAFVPLTAVLVVRLHGTSDDLAWAYCAAESWDWGDGRTEHQEDCEPWEPGTKVRTLYEGRHTYHDPGIYEPRFTLGGRLLAAERLDALPRTGPAQ